MDANKNRDSNCGKHAKTNCKLKRSAPRQLYVLGRTKQRGGGYIDGGNANDISDGVMPSFSPDALKLIVSRPPKYAQQDGATGMSIWMMDADGQNQKMLADQGAWGDRWSPDGRTIVFYGGVDENGNAVEKSCLRLYDVATGSIVNAFSPTESPFSQLSFHFEWSKGNERLVVFGGPLRPQGSNGLCYVCPNHNEISMNSSSPTQSGDEGLPWQANYVACLSGGNTPTAILPFAWAIAAGAQGGGRRLLGIAGRGPRWRSVGFRRGATERW